MSQCVSALVGGYTNTWSALSGTGILASFNNTPLTGVAGWFLFLAVALEIFMPQICVCNLVFLVFGYFVAIATSDSLLGNRRLAQYMYWLNLFAFLGNLLIVPVIFLGLTTGLIILACCICNFILTRKFSKRIHGF